jgi:hypothetical protein
MVWIAVVLGVLVVLRLRLVRVRVRGLARCPPCARTPGRWWCWATIPRRATTRALSATSARISCSAG